MSRKNKPAKTNHPKAQTPNQVQRPETTTIVNKEVITAAAKAVISQVQYYSPVVPAEELQAYENVQEGFANRLLVLAEKEQSHRHDIESKAIQITGQIGEKEISLQRRGQTLAMVAIVLIVILCGYGFYCGFGTQSATIACGTIFLVVGLFVTGRYSKSNNSQTEKPQEEDAK